MLKFTKNIKTKSKLFLLNQFIFGFFFFIIYISPRMSGNQLKPWQLLIAEDGLFIACFDSRNFLNCLLSGYRGWLHFPSMLFAGLTYLLPIEHWAILSFSIHYLLMVSASTLTAFTLKWIFNDWNLAIWATLVLYGNPILQAETLRSLAGTWHFFLLPMLLYIYFKPESKVTFLLIIFGSLWQYDNFLLALISCVYLFFYRGIHFRNNYRNLLALICAVAGINMVLNYSEIVGRFHPIRKTIIIDIVNSISTLIPGLGIGKSWPFAETSPTAYPNLMKIQFIVSLLSVIILVFFRLIFAQNKIRKIYSDFDNLSKYFFALLICYFCLVIIGLQAAARNRAVFQLLMVFLILISMTSFLKVKKILFSIFTIAYCLTFVFLTKAIDSGTAWESQVNIAQKYCVNDRRETDQFELYLPRNSIASIKISCRKLNNN